MKRATREAGILYASGAPDYPPPRLCRVQVAQSLVLCVVLCRIIVCIFLAIVMSVLLRLTASGYHSVPL
jgi:hypothetical protein